MEPLPASPAPGMFHLAEIVADPTVCERAMAEELLREPDLDAKGRGAYLVNRLALALGGSLAALDLAGRDISGVSARVVAYGSALVHRDMRGEIHACLETRVILSPCAKGANSVGAVGGVIERLFKPIVASVAAACGLSRGALWRLVADNVAMAYLNLGKEAGDVERATARAEAILRRPGSKLDFRQLNFVTVEIRASDSPTGLSLCDTFRERAGCCRYYTTPQSEGGFCGTCVLRQDRHAYFRESMIEKALAETARSCNAKCCGCTSESNSKL